MPFSLYTGMTGKIDDELAAQAVSSILRFLTRMGIIRYYSHSGYIASVLKEGDLEPIMTEAAGIFIKKAECGQEVSRGDVLAQIMKGCVDEYSECSVDEIAEKYIEGTPEVGTVGVHVDDTNRLPRTPEVITGSNNEDSTLTEGTVHYDV